MATMNVEQVAEAGKKLYEEEFKGKFAIGHAGEVLAIEVTSRIAYLGKTPLEALSTGEAANEAGLFYLVRIGSPGVYQLRSTRPASRDRVVS